MAKVIGLDAHKRGWIGITLEDGRFSRAAHFRDFTEVIAASVDASVITVDIPVGLPESGYRAADRLARKFVGALHPSVFLIPPRAVMEQPSYAAALEVCRELTGGGTSKQAYGLRTKIFEVQRHAEEDSRVVEIHPEVSFRGMAGRPLRHGKRQWGGFVERRHLLDRAGIILPDDLGEEVNKVGMDDVLDAAAAAWSARRFARGEAHRLPDNASTQRPCDGIIWY